MKIILLSVAIVGILFGLMAIGVIFGRKPIKGSCGGLSSLGLGECEFCEHPSDACKAKRELIETQAE